jgi:hypothetical protein
VRALAVSPEVRTPIHLNCMTDVRYGEEKRIKLPLKLLLSGTVRIKAAVMTDFFDTTFDALFDVSPDAHFESASDSTFNTPFDIPFDASFESAFDSTFNTPFDTSFDAAMGATMDAAMAMKVYLLLKVRNDHETNGLLRQCRRDMSVLEFVSTSLSPRSCGAKV